MSSTIGLGRRLVRFTLVSLAVLLGIGVVATPAHATLGPAQPVNLQLRGYDDYGNQTLVGRVVGTIQFDDGNHAYHVALTVCRQSSYTTPHVWFTVNGVHGGLWTAEDGIRRPDVCPGHGLSGVINGTFTSGSVIQNVTVNIRGIYFNGSTAQEKSKSAFYDNPYN